jgi:hypothetical protein
MNYDLLKQIVDPAPSVKIMINVGAGLDITTGTYVRGRYGEYVLNGGVASFTGVVGIGNQFKSTIMHFMFLMSMIRMAGSTGNTYDTEINIHEWHLIAMIKSLAEKYGMDMVEEAVWNLLENQRWVITDKTVYSGNEWYEKIKEYLETKRKNQEKISVATPFWNRDRSGPYRIMLPTFTEIDSFTEFETDDVMKMQDENELGESGGNTIHMRQGLAKTRMLMEAPRLHAGSNNCLFMTAHLGKESTMQNAGPAGSVPIVKLQHLKNGDKIKGVTDRFTFLTNNCFHVFNAKPLYNEKAPMYPRDASDDMDLNPDLNIVSLRNLRSKSGISGLAQFLIISQTEGVLPALTEFHHIKENGRYGLEGTNVSYALALYPECKIGRTTVRGKIDTDARLRRALNITSEMCQMSYLWHHLPDDLVCTPKQLYEDLKARGYDWDELLATRGWWTWDNEFQTVPFLSTMDLLRMRKGWYHPYWMPLLPGMTERPAGPSLEGLPLGLREKDDEYKQAYYRYDGGEWKKVKQ